MSLNFHNSQRLGWSGRVDLNHRPPGPEPDLVVVSFVTPLPQISYISEIRWNLRILSVFVGADWLPQLKLVEPC